MRTALWPVAVLLVACAPESPDASLLLPDEGGFSDALDVLDRDLAAAEALQGDAWMPDARVATLRLRRARLVGGYADYNPALEALEAAFSKAPEGSGPFTARAEVLASLHRIDEAMPDVDKARSRLLLDDITAARLDLLRADLDWQGGLHREALDEAERVEAELPSFLSATAVAHRRWHTLDDAGADAAFDLAEARIPGASPHTRAWLHLQRGIHDLDRERYDQALEHYLDADRTFPGWWLVQEHVAEILVLTGREGEAQVIYEDVVERTGAPEFMDALAGLADARGEVVERDVWLARAEGAYEAQLQEHPEAAAGHALDHFLEFGPADRALELAEANVEARPNAEAYVKLASARLGVNDAAGAVEALEVARATSWRNVDFYDVSDEVYPAAGMSVPESRPW